MFCKSIYIGSIPILDSVIDVRMVGPKIVALGLAGSNPVYHPTLRGERFPTGLISRVSQVRPLTPQQKHKTMEDNVLNRLVPRLKKIGIEIERRSNFEGRK